MGGIYFRDIYGKKPNKYKNIKYEEDGLKFDSKKEYERYLELKMLQSGGAISDLKTQVRFELIPSQREPDRKGPKGGVIKGKVLERSCSYIADFTYRDRDGNLVVEDTKSPVTRTEAYKIKKKLMLYVHNISIVEI